MRNAGSGTPAAPPTGTSSTAYRVAIDSTADTIVRRGRLFRNLVIAVVATGLVSVTWALFTRSPLPLSGSLLMVPACGLFFRADVTALKRWRETLLDTWARCDLDLWAFESAIRAHPTLPRDTTESMLATLPPTVSLTAERRITPPTRRSIAAEVESRDQEHADRLLFDAVASGVAAVSIIGALSARSWVPLACLTLVALRPAVASWSRHRTRRRLEQSLATLAGAASRTESGRAGVSGQGGSGPTRP